MQLTGRKLGLDFLLLKLKKNNLLIWLLDV